ncbi:MAG TPA: lytic transglycosylase domain-containing protein [Phycisphaerae bacterium]|nr:lytic transglycosylase domain-containing protein [Phycisphaerae bacterium]
MTIIRTILAAALVAGAVYLAPPTPQLWGRERVEPDPMVQVAAMKRRAQVLQDTGDEVIRKYVRDVFPLEYALLKTGRVRDPWMARVAAWALVLEGEKRDMRPRLFASIMQEENPWLVPDTTSYAGAVGWMQVMPFHAVAGGRHRVACGSDDLTAGPVSVCYGADIYRLYFGRALRRALEQALDGYSGCVSKPGCELYAQRVLARVND